MRISVLNRKLNQAFGGKVTAALEDNCIVLRGTLDRWDDVVRAGQMAATKYSTCHVVNDITFTGGQDAPMHVPALRDRSLDGQTPDVLIIGGGISGVSIARELARKQLDILVVDKECDLALGASGRNDGEVHPGIDLGRGSVKHKVHPARQRHVRPDLQGTRRAVFPRGAVRLLPARLAAPGRVVLLYVAQIPRRHLGHPPHLR